MKTPIYVDGEVFYFSEAQMKFYAKKLREDCEKSQFNKKQE
jgi:hypothetical protein